MKTITNILTVTTFFILTLISNHLLAQNYSFHIDGGVGYGNSKTTLNNQYILNGSYKNQASLTGHLGLSAKYFISNNVFFETGIQFLNYKTTDRVLINSTEADIENRYISNNYFLSVPLKIGYSFNKLQLKVGHMWNKHLTSTRRSTFESLDVDQNIITQSRKDSNIKALKFNQGIVGSLGYQLTNKLDIEGFLCIWLNDISGRDELGFISSRKLSMAGINIQYKIFSNNRPE